MSFKDLKKNRSASMEKLVEAAKKLNERSFESGNETFWTCQRDKAGNGYAVIRFLPAPEGESTPWVRFWDHGFKGPTGKWYIEKSLTSIDLDDPVSQINSALWNTGIESDKAIARDRKRRLHYVSNVLVVSDPANPGNEGKVMKFKFGKKIFDKIMDAMNPAPGFDEDPLNPFDLWEGANFKLKVQTIENFPNYDKSSFAAPAALFDGDDKKLEELYSKLEPLSDFVNPEKYKKYDELVKKLRSVIGNDDVNRYLNLDTAAAPLPQPVAAREAPSRTADLPPEDEVVDPGFGVEDADEDDKFFARLNAAQ
jgi:hypothetical protein